VCESCRDLSIFYTHRREIAVGYCRPRTVRRAASTAVISRWESWPTTRPRRSGWIAAVCSARTYVVLPSTSISGRKLAGRALVEVGATSRVDSGSRSDCWWWRRLLTLRNLLAHVPAEVAAASLNDEFPWLTLLPANDVSQFVAEFIKVRPDLRRAGSVVGAGRDSPRLEGKGHDPCGSGSPEPVAGSVERRFRSGPGSSRGRTR
jgi:hypothetical protein